jgi:hypothetical protein
MPMFVVLAQGGISGCFVVCYTCTNDVFPILFCSSAIGMCNFSSRFMTIFSDEIAEVKPPLPLILFSTLCALATVLTWFIKPLSVQKKMAELKEQEQKEQ